MTTFIWPSGGTDALAWLLSVRPWWRKEQRWFIWLASLFFVCNNHWGADVSSFDSALARCFSPQLQSMLWSRSQKVTKEVRQDSACPPPTCVLCTTRLSLQASGSSAHVRACGERPLCPLTGVHCVTKQCPCKHARRLFKFRNAAIVLAYRAVCTSSSLPLLRPPTSAQK